MSFLTAVFHRPRTFAVLALICSCQVWAAPSRLDTDAITSGTLITRTDQGDVQALPLLSTSVNTEVSGQLGKTELISRTVRNIIQFGPIIQRASGMRHHIDHKCHETLSP